MRYIPAKEQDIQRMLQAIGIRSMEELFESIPAEYKFSGKFSFPNAMSEQELTTHLWGLSTENQNLLEWDSFLGGGAYHHYVPALVDALLSRGEFLTSYTPYQPEISQGTLQAIFEFQTYMCQITGLDIANASMYDGASSAAEAVLMARRILPSRNKILISSAIHPNYRAVIGTYTTNLSLEVMEIPIDENGQTDADALEPHLDQAACVIIQSPNYFGVIENQDTIFSRARTHGALCISVIAEALSLGILKSPGECGADIAVGETQSLGLPVAYGGPYAGFFATRSPYVRMMPGRLVGMARDHQGRHGFVLTLAAREQHIRREKATSNICTNQGLCALAVTIHLSFLGAEGFRQVALRNLQMADYARSAISSIAKLKFKKSPIFNEFVAELNLPAEEAVQRLLSRKIFAGIPLSRYYKDMQNSLLICVTEMTRKKQIDRLVEELGALQ